MLSTLALLLLTATSSVELVQKPSRPRLGDAVIFELRPPAELNCDLFHRQLAFHRLDHDAWMTTLPVTPDSPSSPTSWTVKVRCWKRVGEPWIAASFSLKPDRPTHTVTRLSVPPHTVTWSAEDQARMDQEAEEVKRLTSWRFPSLVEGAVAALDKASAPVKGPMTSPFNSPRLFNNKAKVFHTGVDLAASAGHPVTAPLSGVVVLLQESLIGGKTIFLHHGSGLVTSYAHLSRVDVHIGQWVAREETIGGVGQSGRATGPHLHWEAYWYGDRFNARSLLFFGQGGQKVLPLTLTLTAGLGSVKSSK